MMRNKRDPTDSDSDTEEIHCSIINPLHGVLPDLLRDKADAFSRLVSAPPRQNAFEKGWVRLARLTGFSYDPTCNSERDFDVTDPLVQETEAVDDELQSLFRKAARVAQNPQKPRSIDDLSNYEKDLLENERNLKFWDQPKALRVTVVTLCFSAIIQGWIQSGSNGANLHWPSDFKLIGSDGRYLSKREEWIFAAVNAITYLTAGICGCWISDPLQSHVLGRRGAVFVSGLVCFASLIGTAFTKNWQQLLVCRTLVGLGMGAKASVTPIFGAEVSPSHLRGALVMNWQLFDAFGIFLGAGANLVLLNVSSSLSWRLQFASACIPTGVLLTLIWTIPESPRWLLKQRKYREAFEALCALRGTRLQAAIELFYADAQLQEETKLHPPRQKDVEKSAAQGQAEHVEEINASPKSNTFQDSYEMTNYFSRIIQLFRDPRTRRATTAALVVMIGQQLCGVNVIAFYGSTFFHDSGGISPPTDSTDRPQTVKALWLSWGWALANFVFTFPAYYLIDTKGRRFLLFCTYPGMTLSMLAASLSFLSPSNITDKVAVFMFIFCFFYSWGQGPVAFAYSAEVFPLINREAGMSFAVFVNLLGAGILTLFVPQAQTTTGNGLTSNDNFRIGQAHLLAIFVGLNVVAVILIFLFVPETAGAAVRKEDGRLDYMKLEELNHIFNAATSTHIRYQVKVMLPYAVRMTKWWTLRWFSKAIRDNRPIPPVQMWVWEEGEEESEQLSDHIRSTTVLERLSVDSITATPSGRNEAQVLKTG